MARPKVIDYDPASDETVVTSGVEGAEVVWFGIAVARQIVHIVCNEGSLSIDGDEIDTVTRKGLQVTLDGADALSFYTANKTAIDDIIRAALLKFAEMHPLYPGKTGVVIET